MQSVHIWEMYFMSFDVGLRQEISYQIIVERLQDVCGCKGACYKYKQA